jgi:hypothetical protein
MDRVTQRFIGAESKDLGGASFTHAALSFSTTGAASVFPWSRERKEVPVTIKCVSQQILLSGFGG